MIQVEDLTSYPKLAQITLICYRFNIFFLNIVFNFCKSNNILSIGLFLDLSKPIVSLKKRNKDSKKPNPFVVPWFNFCYL